MTKFFKKFDSFMNEGAMIDLSTIFVSAVFGRSLFEYRKVNLKLCVSGINNILEKSFNEFTSNNVNEAVSVDRYDQAMEYLNLYIEKLETFIDSLNKKIIDKEQAKELVDLIKKIDKQYFSPAINDILAEHLKDFNKLRLITKPYTSSIDSKPFVISKQDIEKKTADLAVLKDSYLDLVRDQSDIEYGIENNKPLPDPDFTVQFSPGQNKTQNSDPKNPDFLQIQEWLKKFPELLNMFTKFRFDEKVSMRNIEALIKDIILYRDYVGHLPKPVDQYELFDELSNDIKDLKSKFKVNNTTEITKNKPTPWSNGKKETLTNYLIENYKKQINEYLVDIAKSKFTNPTAKARVEYNKILEKSWVEYKDELFEKWKDYYLIDKLSKFFEIGIKMTTTKLHDYKDNTDNDVAQRVLEKLPFIDASSLESGISHITAGNFYMVPILGNNDHPTPHCIIFFIPNNIEQIDNHAGLWAIPIAKVKFNNFKYKVEQFFLDSSNNLLSSSPIFLVTNTKANLDIDGQKILLVKVVPNEFNMLKMRYIRVENPDTDRKENRLYIGSPIFKLLASEMKDKFKIDKNSLHIKYYPKDKDDIETYFFRQKRTKKDN
jgi:hypothetical protein